MDRYVACLLGLILLVVVACAPSVRPTQPLVTATVEPPTPAVAATQVLPTPDWSGLLGNAVDSGDPSQADQSVREVVDWARETSGLRAELGPHADEIFQLVDQAQSALAEDLMDQWPAGAKPKGMPAPLPPRRWTPPRASALMSLVMVSTYLVFEPRFLRESQLGDSGPQDKEYDDTFGENITAHVKQQSQITGSKLEMELEMKLRAEKDGTVYEEQAKGKIAITICPDEKGNVPLDLTLQSGAGIGDKGFEIKMAMHAVGHVDDEGNLAGYDEDGQTEVTVQTGRNLFGGVNTEQAQVNLGYSLSGLNTPDVEPSVTVGRNTMSLSFLFARREVQNLVDTLSAKLSSIELRFGFESAESKWQDGFCVSVNVAEGESQQVEKGSETSFNAKVQHKIEGTDLAVPVIATLKSGAVSITPSSVKVPAVATFRYKAPDKAGETATVELISRSRRGIGKLDVTFETQVPYYRVDTEISNSANVFELYGDICSLDKPFKIKADGHNYFGMEYVGEYVFTPTSESGGSWDLKATTCVPGGTCGKCFANSTYQLVGVADGKPVLMIPASSAGCEVAGYVASYDSPAWQIELEPATGECSAE